ncbi:MAG TPA: ATP-binding protein [Terracidiphilus sp.]
MIGRPGSGKTMLTKRLPLITLVQDSIFVNQPC